MVQYIYLRIFHLYASYKAQVSFICNNTSAFNHMPLSIANHITCESQSTSPHAMKFHTHSSAASPKDFFPHNLYKICPHVPKIVF